MSETPGVPHSRTVLSEEDVQAALAVLRSGQVNESGVTRELERSAASLLGREHAWATAGGTSALHSALLCMGIKPGDEVLVPTYVCDDVLSAVLQSGARPVPVDTDPDDLNPDPADARRRVGASTRATVLAHTLGMPARVGEFVALGPPVIEDCAHALGANLGGDPAGSLGACAVLSFHGLKMVTAGEGGMVLTDSAAIAERDPALRHPDFAAGQYRLHSRMSNVLASIAMQQLLRLDETVRLRRSLAARYTTDLSGLAGGRPVPQGGLGGRESSGYRCAIVINENLGFDQAAAAFLERGVIIRRPIKQLCHRSLGLDPKEYPRAEEIFDRVISLPLYPSLTEREQDAVIAATRQVLA